MARGVNMVILMGNVGADPELRYTGDGTAVVNFSLATNEAYKNSDGELVEKTEWHRLVAFGRAAEVIGEYVKKGTGIHVTGQLQTRQWEDNEGVTRYNTEVKIREFTFTPNGTNDGSGGTSNATSTSASKSKGSNKKASTKKKPSDELPF